MLSMRIQRPLGPLGFFISSYPLCSCYTTCTWQNTERCPAGSFVLDKPLGRSSSCMAATYSELLIYVLLLASAALTASGHRWQQETDCSVVSTGCIACSYGATYGYGRGLLQAHGDNSSTPIHSNSSILDRISAGGGTAVGAPAVDRKAANRNHKQPS